MTIALGRLTRRDSPLALASLALNAFLLALVAAHLFAGPPPASTPGTRLARLTANLRPEDAASFHAAIAAHAAELDPAHARVIEAERLLADALARRPYDAAAVGAAEGEWQDGWRRFSEPFSRAMRDAMGSVSDAGRARLSREMADDADRRAAEEIR